MEGDTTCDVMGNPMSLLFYDNFKYITNLPSDYIYAFTSLFSNCTTIVNAKKLSLCSQQLTKYCYKSMFQGCTSLVNAPKLPATTLTGSCYFSMFRGCTSLVNAPELPATTLAEGCYSNMFRNCTSLNNVTMLATNISASGCLNYWLDGVSSTGTFTKHPSMTSLPRDASGIPANWTVVDYAG